MKVLFFVADPDGPFDGLRFHLEAYGERHIEEVGVLRDFLCLLHADFCDVGAFVPGVDHV